MKNKQLKQIDFQKIYASNFTTVLFFAVAIEIYFLVMIFFGGAR